MLAVVATMHLLRATTAAVLAFRDLHMMLLCALCSTSNMCMQMLCMPRLSRIPTKIESNRDVVLVPSNPGKDLNGPKRQRKHLARIQAFTDAALGSGGPGGAPPLHALVRKLQVRTASQLSSCTCPSDPSRCWQPAGLLGRSAVCNLLEHNVMLQAALASVEDLPVLAPSALPLAGYRYYHHSASYGALGVPFTSCAAHASGSTHSSRLVTLRTAQRSVRMCTAAESCVLHETTCDRNWVRISVAANTTGAHRRADPGSLQAGLAALSQPFKLRLCKAPGAEQCLRDYSTNVVLIEPLATMGAIEVRMLASCRTCMLAVYGPVDSKS